MQQLAPKLWDLLGLMLSAGWREFKKRKEADMDVANRLVTADNSGGLVDDHMSFWDEVDDITIDDVDILEHGGHTSEVLTSMLAASSFATELWCLFVYVFVQPSWRW
jgi:hypothetical protein